MNSPSGTDHGSGVGGGSSVYRDKAFDSASPRLEHDSLGPPYPMSEEDLERARRPNPADPTIRALDIMFSAGLLVVLAPLLVVVGLIIKATSPGPIFFKQVRHGLHGKRFTILKFRSMRDDPKPQVFKQTDRDDARVTQFGAFLRRTSIDELPQLINVLVGDMSLVGPRPLPTTLDYEVGAQLFYFAKRFGVRPGITGLAQSRGHRGPIVSKEAARKRTLMDIIYVRRRSVQLYFAVLIATAIAFLFHTDAY